MTSEPELARAPEEPPTKVPVKVATVVNFPGGALPAESSGNLGDASPAPVQSFDEPITPAEAGLPGFNR